MGHEGLPDSSSIVRVADFVDWWADRRPDLEALAAGPLRYTYRELRVAVNRCARALLASGVKRGDRIAFLGTPRPEFLITFLAAGRVGAIWLGLNPRYQQNEIQYVIHDAHPSLLIGMTQTGGRDFTEALSTFQAEHDYIERVIPLGTDDRSVEESFEAFLVDGDGVPAEALHAAASAVQPLDCALIVYTSGSSGQPKGAMLSHRGLVRCSLIQNQQFECDPLRILCNLPINHIGCTGDICCYALAGGGTIVCMEAFDPEGSLRVIQDERLTVWGQVPTQLQLSMAVPGFASYDLSSLKLIAWGGAAAPRELIERLGGLGVELATNYGMTETTGAVTFTCPGDPVEVLADTVGRPIPEYEVRIAGADGTPCAPGEEGEIHVRGDFIMLGYFNRPDATADAIDAEGWLHTGDVAFERDDGNYRIVGRLSDMYKSGGYNVYPREIEQVLEAHPNIAAAAVVGVPDPLYQEVGHAFVVPATPSGVDESALLAFCREHLANYKVPKRILVRDMLPMLPAGKVDKISLVREAHAQLESEDGEE